MPTISEYKSLEPLIAALPEGSRFNDLQASFFDSLLLANGVPIDGVIHLGASRGQEVWLYTVLGFRRALMVEPVPQQFARLSASASAMAAYTRAVHALIGHGAKPPIEFHCVQCAVSNRSGTSTFYRTALPQSSSLSRPVTRPANGTLDYEEIQVDVRTLDDLMLTLPAGWSVADFTYLRMNIQNAELLALEGGEQVLRHIRGIFLEINVGARYEDQPRKEDFDRLLAKSGFVCTFGMAHDGVGNLFYRRQ
jgi:FkbM family methyltransferase